MRLGRGKVVTGVGDFAFWIEKLKEYYRGKTGMNLFPGTLNVQLDEPFDLPLKRTRLEAQEYGGTVSVNIAPCKIFGRRAFILRTDKAESDPESRKILEVACDVKLRDQYRLRDGDIVEIEVEE
jgi:riboflavin kinase